MGDTVFSSVSLEGTGQFSIRTLAAASDLASGQFGILQHASGLSIIYRSDDTAYTVGASAVSAAI